MEKIAEYARSVIFGRTGTKPHANNGVSGLLWGTRDGWVVGGVGLYKKIYSPEDICLKLPRQMRRSAARGGGNDLVNVTFISLSVGYSFTIVVAFVPASETYIISPFMGEIDTATRAENQHTPCLFCSFATESGMQTGRGSPSARQ